jgi:hypothetical protein
VSAQGQYAGSASRFAAYLIDLIASTVLYLLALAIISFVVQIVTGSPVSWLASKHRPPLRNRWHPRFPPSP